MTQVRVSPVANSRLDDIYRYTRSRWGGDQADAYIRELFDCFERIALSKATSRPVPPEFGVNGWYVRHRSHVIYWRRLGDAAVGIVTILHKRMHQLDRFRDDLG